MENPESWFCVRPKRFDKEGSMKRMDSLGLSVNAMLLAVVVGLLLKGRTEAVHAAGGGGRVPVGNGDANGDGRIDISDAVYTLSWLFTGGPAPVPIECPTPGGMGLPDTGQTKCYDAAGAEVSCDNAPCPDPDGSYETGCPMESRFVDNGDGTVTDTCTWLMWQKDTADVGMVGACEALAYCENLSFAGHDDWRLPNVRELQSIVDYGRSEPAIDPIFAAFPHMYWSSTRHVVYPEVTWFVTFRSGYVTVIDFEQNSNSVFGYVRAVRHAQ
jgi:hypothetical protein